MKKLILTVAAISLAGCASLSDKGAISQSSYTMPDGQTVTFVRIKRINFFTPSTEEKMTFTSPEVGGFNTVMPNLDQNYQNGMGPAVVSGAIQAGATIGGAYLLKEGLADSGDTINNGSSSASKQAQGQLQGQLQGQFQGQKMSAGKSHKKRRR